MPRERTQKEVPAFARRLRRLRMRAGLAQRELAARCGLSPSQVSLYEAGRHRPRARNLARLANGLNVPVETLAGRPAAQPPRARPERPRAPG